MGGGKGSSTPSPEVTSGLLQNENALTQIAQQQETNAQGLYSLTEPGLQTAENQYQTLAAGDPGAILRATAPATQQVTQATQGAKANILRTTPAGGEKNLALENADVAQGSQIGQIASGAVAGAPNALATLAGQGVGESISAAGTGISGLSSANQGLSSLGNMQIEEQQIQAQQKGSVLGAFSSLAGVGGELGSASILANA
jgi:hypothetical protein